MNQAVEQLESLLHDQPKNPLRPSQVAAQMEEMERLEQLTKAPPYVPGDRGAAFRRLRLIRDSLHKEAPRRIEEESRRNEVHRLSREVLETVIKPSMLPRSTMRRNPPGAVSRFIRQENSKEVKRAILTWRRARFALDPTTDDADHANVELHRPEGTGAGASTFMPDAQIPGNFAMTSQAKENWPLGDAKSKTAISHLQQDAPAICSKCEKSFERTHPNQRRCRDCRPTKHPKKLRLRPKPAASTEAASPAVQGG